MALDMGTVDVEDALDRLGIEVAVDRGDWVDCLCPFHDESKPSFSVSVEHGGWVCRHGGGTGGLVSLASRIRGVTFAEAEEWLRTLPPATTTSAELLRRLSGAPLKDEYDEMAEWAERYDELDPGVMSEYWFHRGFTAQTMREFGVRYDPDGACLMFPVRLEGGELVGFVKRMVPPVGGRRKYDYPIGFSRPLFPLYLYEGHDVVLVEGPLDAMWLRQNGWRGALSTLGSSVSRAQVSWLASRVTGVTILFDNDDAGREGAARTAKMLRGRVPAKVASVPDGFKDAQEMSRGLLAKSLDGAKWLP